MEMLRKIRKEKMNKKGFTLVELIVVLVILAILAAILVPQLLGYIDRAKNKQVVAEARMILMAANSEIGEASKSTETTDVKMDTTPANKTTAGKVGLASIAELAELTLTGLTPKDAPAPVAVIAKSIFVSEGKVYFNYESNGYKIDCIAGKLGEPTKIKS